MNNPLSGIGMATAVLLIFSLSLPAAPPPRIDGRAALERTAEFVRIGPRPSGSEGARRAAAYLEQTCRQLGYPVQIDSWREADAPEAPVFRNVRATLEGTGEDFIIVASHYDTKRLPACPGFVGANDSGSSTGLLLTIMERLAVLPEWTGCTVEFLFFDGEECLTAYSATDGLHGSRRYAAQLGREGRVGRCRAMLLLDMVGDLDLTITLCRDNDPDLLRRTLDIARAQGVQRHFGFYPHGTILDDHRPFQELGIPCLNFIDFVYGPGNRFWHTGQDTLDKLSADSLAIVGNVATRLLLDLAGN